MGSKEWVLTTGFTKNGEREFAIWDIKKFDSPYYCNILQESLFSTHLNSNIE
jgi:hypothetical protein